MLGDFSNAHSFIWIIYKSGMEQVLNLLILYVVDDLIQVALVDDFAYVLKCVGYLQIRRDHFQEHQAEAVHIIFRSFLFVLEDQALVNLRSLRIV